jgi:hypothetical protein
MKAFTDSYTESIEGHIPVKEMYDRFILWCVHKNTKVWTTQRLVKRLNNIGLIKADNTITVAAGYTLG